MIPLYYPGDRVVVRDDLVFNQAFTIGSYTNGSNERRILTLPVSIELLRYKGKTVTIGSVYFIGAGFYVYTIEENGGLYFAPEMIAGIEEDQILQSLDGIEDFFA